MTNPTRIGDLIGDWQEAAEKAWQAQQKALQTPKGKRLYEEYKAREREEDQKTARRAYLGMGIPGLTADALINGKDLHGRALIVPTFEQEMLKALKNGKLLIALFGVVGVGKTLSACRWVRMEGGLYVKAKDFCALSEKFDRDRPQVESYRNVPNLVLDEVAMETKWEDHSKIEALLHHRYEEALVTLILANMRPEKFLKTYGDRVARRIFAMGHRIVANTVLCPGEKRRQFGEQGKLGL